MAWHRIHLLKEPPACSNFVSLTFNMTLFFCENSLFEPATRVKSLSRSRTLPFNRVHNSAVMAEDQAHRN